LLRRLHDRRTIPLQVILALSAAAVPLLWLLGTNLQPMIAETVLVGLVATVVLMLPRRTVRIRYVIALATGATALFLLPLAIRKSSAVAPAGAGGQSGLQMLIVSVFLLMLVTVLDQLVDARVTVEEQLRRSLEKAREVDRMKSEFLCNVSHELRTPMSGILGTMDLLLETGLSTDQREFAEICRASGRRLLGTIKSLLSASAIETGRISLARAPFDLRAVVNEAVVLVQDKARRKRLDLAVHCAPAVPRHLVGDAAHLRQVLVNLVDNAVKFTERGHVFVSVDGSKSGENHAELRIAVEDTGIGIPPDRMQLIFERFTQADGSSTRKYEGTGLGLAISQRLAHLMGGEITADSRVGKGSTFRFEFSLPLARPPHAASQGKAAGPADAA